jgi:DNA repair exonuclease SbcCD ATPase subunit
MPGHFGAYLKTAFLYRWNLLIFLAALGLAVLSGRPDVGVPLVLAGELAYLGALASHPRFQAYVDAQAAKAVREAGSGRTEQTLARILRSLPPKSLQRFVDLRARCLELRQLAAEIKDPSRAGSSPPLEELQLAGLDRLLWIYLRLLFTGYSLERFLLKTRQEQIEQDIANLEARLKQADAITDEVQRQKVHKAVEDNLQTCRDRLANFRKAKDNYDLVQLEIDRLENKIRALSELAVNRQEPDFISTQVDQVATSMVQTERTMNELQFATGLETADDVVPELMQRAPVVVKQP